MLKNQKKKINGNWKKLEFKFLIKSKHEIGIKYTNKSILEQMHIVETIKILK